MSSINKIFAVLLLAASCTQVAQQTEPVANPADYEKYLNIQGPDLSGLEKDEAFWKEKLVLEPRGFIFYEKLGSTYHQLFEKTGKVHFLNKADSVFSISERLTRGKWKVPSLLSQSSLSIKKHDFKKAAKYALMANELTDEKFGPLLMQYDAEMEVGNFQIASAILKRTKRMDSFDYLVRLSKYKDHQGDLDSAIIYMEKAYNKLLFYQKDRKLWATTNLADMYGHAGRIKDSYSYYLKALSIDSTYAYALKGIAWIQYSHDDNPEGARKILESLLKRTALPDYNLLLAEIDEYQERESESKYHIDRFLKEATKPEYAGMYNKYLIEINQSRGNFYEALELAKEEVSRRSTPATNDWLAWTLFQQGRFEEAVEVYRKNVEGETFEPDVLFHMGVVYSAQGVSKGDEYLKEALEASFELGPKTISEIKSRFNG